MTRLGPDPRKWAGASEETLREWWNPEYAVPITEEERSAWGRALDWWDGRLAEVEDVSFDDVVAGRSARDRAYGLSTSAPLSPAGTVKGEHIAQNRACGGIGAGLAIASGLLLGLLIAVVIP